MGDKERVEAVIKYLKTSVLGFARSLGYDRADKIYNILKDRNGISADVAKDITRNYNNIRYEWLLTGQGEMLKIEDDQELSSIPYYDISISAGTVNFFKDYPELPHSKIQIPFIHGVDLAMPVYGDSMYPKIKNGDVVLLKEVHDKSVIMFGEIYLVITEDYRTLKYVRKGEAKEEVLLVSENDRYDPVSMPLNNILHLFLYKGKFEKSQI